MMSRTNRRSKVILLTLAIFFTAIITINAAEESEDRISDEYSKAEYCDIAKCQLPNCRCSAQTLPKPEFQGHEKEIPQFITVTFDDAVNIINFPQYQQIFDGLVNPDHCPARGTFFVSHEYTDYSKVNALYTEGHEIALHSVTHSSGTDYWRDADVDLLEQEFGGLIDMLEAYAKVNRKHIRGMRLPFLQLSGNNSFIAAKRVGLIYDSSWPTQRFRNPAMWPYTLDYHSLQDCVISPCPDASLPGFWINPMVTWVDTKGYSCSMIDGCIYPPEDNEDALFEWMLENFKRHYEGNRAPFGMYLHAAWFSRLHHALPAFRRFLLHVNTLQDVYITTVARVVQYMHQPVLGTPFKGCVKKPKTECTPRSCGLTKTSTGEIRYMTVCGSCPQVYPWLGNPLGKH
ncbi:chitin deacetylase 8-like [Teleopsis dalmanni]|uniref:chitin deacetylase 8-like n=1 Tax=Teleopsis dalmanni TaxID=139649 RepID=UPI0018CD2D3B|nr:chitin deacetylase 8-like [Teleopsis dalmanni]